ncbi:glycosyltransferase family 2 protein [Thalassotalea sp. PS06]|uniref:glycosyltransferase family 2 protein n=1 Tax=Thalassotalea sp. PS06 TaxID=2594005 RepID=UPI00163D7555|nr:glycosyltransferase family 2 protein [Thalassotalea sp. PS06]
MVNKQMLIEKIKNKAKRKTKKKKLRCQFDGFDNGFLIGWVPAFVESIDIFIQGKKVATGKCDQPRDDVKEALGIDAKGFRVLLDGHELEQHWSYLPELNITIEAIEHPRVKVEKTISLTDLVDNIEFLNQRPTRDLKVLIEKSLLWNESYYFTQLNGDRALPKNPIKDYILFGSKMRLDPSSHFSTNYYLDQVKEDKGQIDNSLVHYLTYGELNGFKPNPYFDPLSYRKLNSDLDEWQHSLLAHYAVCGQSEGRVYNDTTNFPVVTKEIIKHVEKEFPYPRKASTQDSFGHCEYVIWGKNYAFIVGWYIGENPLLKLSLSVDDSSYMLTEESVHVEVFRPDVKNAFSEKNVSDFSGFLATVKIKESVSPVNQSRALFVHLIDENGSISVPVQSLFLSEDDKVENCARVLNCWDPQNTQHQKKASDVILPIIQDIYPVNHSVWAKRVDFGSQVEEPKASVIIPLYGRYDFMRYQLSNFARFNGLDSFEVIYVVDDPSIVKAVEELAVVLHKTFEFSFSVVFLEKNVGYGQANNIGVNFANSDNLILLNSDVIPKDGSWAKELVHQLNTLPDAGIVGARLLFEDESIQHDGMAPMTLEQFPGLLFNDHPKKGFPLTLVNNSEKAEVCPLVTAACVALKKETFESLQGFDQSFVLGDFEDSDLCLRALENGKKNYICRHVKLNHLERLSQNIIDTGGWKHKLTLLNANTYSQRWSKTLQDLYPDHTKGLTNA